MCGKIQLDLYVYGDCIRQFSVFSQLLQSVVNNTNTLDDTFGCMGLKSTQNVEAN